MQISEAKQKGEGAAMSGRQEVVATYTGERTDRGPARLREQTEKGAPGPHSEWLAVGGPPARGSRWTRGRHPRDSRLRTRAPGARVQGGWRATCTGERVDRGPAPWKQQTESVSWERAPPSISRSSGAPVCSLD